LKINQVSLLDLLPENLRSDEKIIASAKAIDEQLNKINNTTPQLLIYKNINLQSERVIDELAKEESVDFYDTSYSRDTKINLIKNAGAWNRRKGTASVVEEVVKEVFSSAKVIEWYEYGGASF